MNIALIGSGGREHSLCKKLRESTKVNKIFCIPGNAGTSKIATNLNTDYNNFPKLLKNLKENKIKLVVIGPEEPLVNGLVNFLNKNKIKAFGPNKFAAKLEGSKSFMKKICRDYQIPTANLKLVKIRRNLTSQLKNFLFR